jgi:hypothetical protein
VAKHVHSTIIAVALVNLIFVDFTIFQKADGLGAADLGLDGPVINLPAAADHLWILRSTQRFIVSAIELNRYFLL